MAKTRATWKQVDVRRAWEAARKDGKDVVKTMITPDGGIVLIHKDDGALQPADAALEDWRARRNAHSS
jgi:hypothetical protein